MGWSNLQNGELIQAAEASFDRLLTIDQNLRYQQNLADRRLAILVLPTTSWPKIQAYQVVVIAAVNEMQAGEYREIRFD